MEQIFYMKKGGEKKKGLLKILRPTEFVPL